MEENVIEEIKADNNKEKNEISEIVDAEEHQKKNDQIEELKLCEFKEIIDPVKSAFEEEAKKEDFFRNDNINSLVLVNENKNTMLDVKKFLICIRIYDVLGLISILEYRTLSRKSF